MMTEKAMLPSLLHIPAMAGKTMLPSLPHIPAAQSVAARVDAVALH